MRTITPATIIAGDGIGPEVVGAARRVSEVVDAPIAWEEVDAGAAVFRRGIASGVPAAPIDSIARTRLVLKGPLETPVGRHEGAVRAMDVPDQPWPRPHLHRS